jgi:pantoate--beta-alanine ligase
MQGLALRWRRSGVRVGFVPTMGYLHEGHLSLVRRARREVGPAGEVVLSIYVNPTQFAPTEDFSRYPRDLKRDTQLCRTEGVDVVFTPPTQEMYPLADGSFSTYVVEENLSRTLEGVSRPTHFRGVTTVVAKLFNIVQPEVAVFGAKDWQQATIIRRMARDLNFPLKVLVAPTFRERDGLAMSSRNKYLEGDLRRQALVLWQAIQSAQKQVQDRPGGISAVRLTSRLKKEIQNAPDARVDYVEFFHSQTLEPVKTVKSGTHMALAVFVGKTRLIDNATLA